MPRLSAKKAHIKHSKHSSVAGSAKGRKKGKKRSRHHKRSTRSKRSFKRQVGSRRQVWEHVAHHTSGGLTRSKLMKNRKTRRIVSKKKHAIGVRLRKQALRAGYFTKKGVFGLFKRTDSGAVRKVARSKRYTGRRRSRSRSRSRSRR
jgi:hypothetical protein